MEKMARITTIIQKEWAEVFKNRLVVFTTIFMPVLFTALPLVILFFTRSTEDASLLSEMPAQFQNFCDQQTEANCLQIFTLSQFIILFMMIPVIIPVNIAAYSIVGEKTTHSLEPLLATPITTGELLIGKNLAAVLPAVLATWAGYAVFAIGAYLITADLNLIGVILDPLWLIAIFVVSPLLSILAVNFAVMVSSRVTDPRVAEQLSVLVILPLLLLMFGQIAGFLVINRQIILLLALAILAVDLVMIPLTVQLFQRETILTRWK
jgi:ABC-2 type transport system permease protein